ncbi:hypothetical protein [Kribbella sp. CA-293567]|uniref:hypothetical protein n=1 Tax=Kribbella sp. CA-293567 TaxID=3002436 RepID=UPI0022DD410F|nr:hypothetical protein [Kribbella sp. CA-293567]WBQ08593.1 hypothetical protein OX958_06870 [Kribbella sp. CA-293567]
MSVGGVGLSRRQFLGAGAVLVATGAAMVGTSGSVSADTYGSGELGPWDRLNRLVSSDDQVRRVLAGDGVFMFGDSIGVQDGNALALRLTKLTGSALAVHNWSGQPAAAAVDALEAWSAKYGLPRRIVMAVGTNDIFKPPAFGPQVDRALRIAGPARTVFWVNTQVSRTRESELVQRADLRNSAWVNRQLDDSARRHPNLTVVRWSEFLAEVKYPHRYLRDGLHTSVPLGQHWRNELILRALRKVPDRPAPKA